LACGTNCALGMEKERLEAERDDAVGLSRSLTVTSGEGPSKKRERSEEAERDDTVGLSSSFTDPDREGPSKKRKE
jgi:hypothetical protein